MSTDTETREVYEVIVIRQDLDAPARYYTWGGVEITEAGELVPLRDGDRVRCMHTGRTGRFSRAHLFGCETFVTWDDEDRADALGRPVACMIDEEDLLGRIEG